MEKLLEGVMESHTADEKIQLAARANDKTNFGHVFIPANEKAMVEHVDEKGDFVNHFFDNQELRRALNDLMMDRVYKKLNLPSDESTG